MLRLMIVDDERAVREAIRDSIDWKSLDIAVIGLFKNGAEAYDAILDEYPDVVLTDIIMPGLSGIELIARVSAAQLNTQFVILSGHAEFEFAKQAMRYGVKHYLLKPSAPQQIIDIMNDVREDCYQRRRQSALDAQQKPLVINMRQTLMRSIITQAYHTNETIENIVQQNSRFIDVTNVNYELCYFYYLQPEYTHTYIEEIHTIFHKIADGMAVHIVYVNLALIVFFESYTSNYAMLDRAFSSLSKGIDQSNVEYVRTPFPNVIMLMQEIVPKLRRFETISLLNGNQMIQVNNYSRLIHECETLVITFSHSPQHAVLEQIENLLCSSCDVGFLRLVASSMLMKYTVVSNIPHALDIATRIALEQENDAQKIREILIRTLWDLSEKIISEDKSKCVFIKQIKSYVCNNLSSSELSLKWLAENQLYMNVDYLSKQFAVKTGEKFSAYLSRMRIEHAKELLVHPGIKIYDVAEAVGCGNNPQYFSRIFKRAVGITPSEYMQKIENRCGK